MQSTEGPGGRWRPRDADVGLGSGNTVGDTLENSQGLESSWVKVGGRCQGNTGAPVGRGVGANPWNGATRGTGFWEECLGCSGSEAAPLCLETSLSHVQATKQTSAPHTLSSHLLF